MVINAILRKIVVLHFAALYGDLRIFTQNYAIFYLTLWYGDLRNFTQLSLQYCTQR